MADKKIMPSESGVVMRLTHSSLLINLSYAAEPYKVQTKVMEWKLPKIIDPNNINPEIEFLSSFISRMVRQYKMEGSLITWIIPHQKSRLKNISIPMNLEVKADKKEFNTLTKATPYDFWKEHDPDLADIKLAEIRSSLLTTNSEENSSSLMYVAVDRLLTRLYQNLSLQSNLYPVGYIAEDQALIKIIESRLSRVQRERPFAIFHLSKGNNRIIYVNAEQVDVAQVNIDELDESLLDDIPDINEENKSFWNEVVGRISTALNTATNYLLEEAKVLKFENMYFISDYDHESPFFGLLRENFRVVNIISLNQQFEYISVQKPLEKKSFMGNDQGEINYYGGSRFIPALGNYSLKYFSETAIPNKVTSAPMMNFHEKAAFIKNNFEKEAVIKKGFYLFGVLLIGALVFSASLFTLNSGDNPEEKILVQSEKKLERLKQAIKSGKAEINQKEAEYEIIADLSNGQTNQKLFEKLIRDIPNDVELDRVIIRDNTFQIFGNSLNVMSVNNFYNTFMQDTNFENIKIDSFRRKDRSMNFFELVGVIKT